MTINIAICDDNKNELESIYQKIFNMVKNINKPFSLKKFELSKELIKSLKKDFYDLVFLDIEMKPYSGPDIAKYINIHLPDTKIVFITNHNDFAYSMYRYAPIAFIRKNNLSEDLEENLDVIFNKLNVFYEYYHIVDSKNPKRLKVSEICYIKSNKNDIEFYMANHEIICQRKTFKSILGELNDRIMVQKNKGILINVMYINKMGEDNKLGINNLFLTTGEAFYINKTYYNGVKKKFFEYDN